MVIPSSSLGLSAAQFRIYRARLTKTHTAYYRITLMDLNHRVLKDLTPRFVDGQITYDWEAEGTTRAAEVIVLDHDRSLGLDTSSGSLSAAAATRMIRIHHVMYVPEFKKWVFCPMFTGPITGLERDGIMLSIDCSGKEYLMGHVWKGAYTIKKGSNRVAAIRKLLNDGGEAKHSIAGSKAKMPSNRAVNRTANRWKLVRSLVSSLSRYAYYNSWGVATSRAWAANSPVYTFSEGNSAAVTSEVNVAFDFADVVNSVRVIGKKPKKGDTPQVVLDLPDYHPASPYAMRRNGRRAYRGREVQNSDLRTGKEVRAYAKAILADESERTVEVSFEAAVIPFLEPNDPCRVVTKTANMVFRLRQCTIPLTPGKSMTVGTTRDLKVVRPKKRKKRKKKKK